MQKPQLSLTDLLAAGVHGELVIRISSNNNFPVPTATTSISTSSTPVAINVSVTSNLSGVSGNTNGSFNQLYNTGTATAILAQIEEDFAIGNYLVV